MRLDREHAHALDGADPLAAWHDRFILPREPQSGRELVYLCGHSLGAQPVLATDYVEEVMRDWRSLGVEGHFAGRHPWMHYHERLAPTLADLVGADPLEVVAMNTLTVNLNLMLASFYRPAGERTRILMERHAFPSDRYAVESHVRWHGLDPARELIEIDARPGEALLRTEDLVEHIEREGRRVATVLLPGVQYLTGQRLELEPVTAAARRAGCAVGWDLAHAVGNVPVRLHDSGADFAVWCNYKYLNGGPGAVGGAFVHERHARDTGLPRLAGWWGHDKATRFLMGPEFHPIEGAAGWQNSNPPILAMAPLAASLEHFAAVGLAALRRKSLALTGYFEALVRERLAGRVEIVTPADPEARGAALSLRLLGLSRNPARAVFDGLRRRLILPDWREPDVIRAAPVPFYNRFDDAWRCVEALRAELDAVDAAR
jgi:kynureninase